MAHDRGASIHTVSLDNVLRELTLTAQQELIGSLPVTDALRLRAACKTARTVVDATLTCMHARIRSLTPAALDGGDDQAWWDAACAPRLNAALSSLARWPRCANVTVDIITPGLISGSTTYHVTRLFRRAQSSGMRMAHVTSLQLYVAEPVMVDRSDRCFSGPAVVLTPQLTQALSALFPCLESLSLHGPCWASPDLADAHLEQLSAPGETLLPQQPQEQQQPSAQAAFAALSPAYLPRLAHLSAPTRVACSPQLQQLSALRSLRVDCNPGDHDPLRELQQVGPAALQQWLQALPQLQHLTLCNAAVTGLVSFALQRPPGLQRLSLLDSLIGTGLEGPGGGGGLYATEDTRLALDWGAARLECGDPRFELPDVAQAVRAFAAQLGLPAVLVTHMQIRASHSFTQQELAHALGQLTAFAAGQEAPSPAAPVGPPERREVSFGALSCSTDAECVELLVRLLRDVGGCAELQLAGPCEAALAALRRLAAAVPPGRLPVRLGLELAGGPEWGWQLMGAMTGLRRGLPGWPPLQCVYLLSTNCDNARSCDGRAGRSATDWCSTLLLASARLQHQEPLPPSARAAQAHAAPAAAAATAAAGDGPEPALRTAPGFWCGLAVPVAGALDGGVSNSGSSSSSGGGAVPAGLGGVLYALPPHLRLHAGRCTVWHSYGGAYHKKNKHTLWLAVTCGARPGLALDGVHAVRFECVGVGRRSEDV